MLLTPFGRPMQLIDGGSLNELQRLGADSGHRAEQSERRRERPGSRVTRRSSYSQPGPDLQRRPWLGQGTLRRYRCECIGGSGWFFCAHPSAPCSPALISVLGGQGGCEQMQDFSSKDTSNQRR